MNIEAAFGLERAAWPVMLVSEGGAVLRANAAATGLFGVAMKGDAPQLAAIWSPANPGTPEEFLAKWEMSPVAAADLKFRVANGATLERKVAICVFTHDDLKWFVLQFLPPGNPAPSEA